MATRSSLRLSRLSDRAIVVQRQLITFTLQQTNFFLPIGWAHRAVAFSNRNITPDGQISFGDQRFPLMDVERSIWGTPSKQYMPDPDEGEEAIAALLLQQPGRNPSWLLPIDSAPALCRIAEDRFVPLPRTYTVQCVNEMTDSKGDYPLHFLLEPLQLMEQAIAWEAPSSIAATTKSQTTAPKAATPEAVTLAAAAPTAPTDAETGPAPGALPAAPLVGNGSATPSPD